MCLRFRSVFLLVIAVLAGDNAAFAQDQPIGYWRSHLPYNNAIGIATDGGTLFAISNKSFFSYNTVNGQLSSYSKVDGMADVGMAKIGYDDNTSTVILAYQNSDIDLYKDNVFFNMPEIRTKNISSDKTINDIYTENGLAYLSTAFGIVVINLDKREVKDTYIFSKNSETIGINAFSSDATYFYAATPKGLYRASKNNPNLKSFSSWLPLDTTRNLSSLATVQQTTFVATTDSLFRLNGTALQFVFHKDSTNIHLDPGKDALLLSVFYYTHYYSSLKKMNINAQITDSFRFGELRQVAELVNGNLWVADNYEGLNEHVIGDYHRPYTPVGPRDASVFDIVVNDKDMWVAHGGYRDNFGLTNNYSGVSHFKDNVWTNYRSDITPAMAEMYDVIDLAKDPADGTIYAGSMQEGMVSIKTDGTATRYKQGILEAKRGEPNVFPATGVAFDQGGNLWVNQLGAVNELAMRTPEGQWYHFGVQVPFSRPLTNAGAGVLVDDYNQKWYYAPQSGGVIVYNDNYTPTDPSDDSYRQFWIGVGSGNLPSSNAFCLAKDRDGAIWVGTDNGIGIISCASAATTGQCDAEQRVVQYDQFPGHLFEGQAVKAIAVDGGNRKWIGTTNGVWLITPDADKIISRFTKETSPLPSNNIQSIGIDPVTGDVYIGTDQGLVSYRGSSTDGGTTNNNVVTFPNPVASTYSGPIAIRGLVTDADVRITDIAGQLIYRTKAQGGTATWNGLDYTGHRPQSGVFLIFITNKDGSQTHVGKLLFQH